MDVGVNYPWFNYGWDFGDAPPGWRSSGQDPNWIAQIDADLQRFRQLGIKVVRWFIIADGLTYGTGSQAPRPDTEQSRLGQWRFDDPPQIGEAFLTHFQALLGRFARLNRGERQAIQLLPVLLDFKFCEPGILPVGRADSALRQTVPDPDWVKQGRADVLIDSQKRRKFFERALQPLLRASQAHPDCIYAWELINEPEWVTSGWHPHRARSLPVNSSDMASFLQEGMRHIRAARFKATIGFNRIETIRQSRIFADYNQFHHYSPTRGGRPLPQHTFAPRYPGIIGEFATSSNEDNWPDLSGASQTTLYRLRHIRDQGYPLALPWSYRGTDRHTSWNSQVEQDIECFTQLRNCP